MKNKDLAIALADCVSNIQYSNEDLVNGLSRNFVYEGTDDSNSEMADVHDMHQKLIRHEILSTQHSYIKKEFDKSKKGLDFTLLAMGYDIDPEPNATREIYTDHSLTLSKRQNKDGTTTLLTDVITNLAKLGVDKNVVDKALKDALKVKRGNVYYIIGVEN